MPPPAPLPTGNRQSARPSARETALRARETEAARKFRRSGTFPRSMGMGLLRVGTAGALLALVATGCGGGQRQDAHEPSGTFDVNVVKDEFPLSQHIAQQSRLRISVRNVGNKTVPNIAVTVKGLSYRDTQPDLADPNRP